MPRFRRPRKYPVWLTSRWFLIAIAIVFFLLAASLAKELIRSYQINQEIAQLKQDISDLEVSNQDFLEFVEYLKTNRYFEEQARLKLGLKAPGERVIVLQNDDEDAGVAADDSSRFAGREVSLSGKAELAAMSNPSKWMAYFFGA